MEKQQIDALATASGYREISAKNPYMYSYIKGEVRINVYYGKMTVATCLNHPKTGRTQLFRRNVSYAMLANIFENPRLHTGKGYYGENHSQFKRVSVAEAMQHSCLIKSDVQRQAMEKGFCTMCLTSPQDLCKNRFVRFINSFFI